MTAVNSAFLNYLTSPLNGGADDDEMVKKYWDIDSNDPITMKNIIKMVLKPVFDMHTQMFRQKAKESLGFYLATGKIDFEKVYNAPLLPIDTPNDPKLFYTWIWEIFFENEDYKPYGTNDYFELYNINEPLEF